MSLSLSFDQRLELNAVKEKFYGIDYKMNDHDELERDLFAEAKRYDLGNMDIPLYIEGFLRTGFNLTIQMNQNKHQDLMIPRIVSYFVFCYIKSMRQVNAEDATKVNMQFTYNETLAINKYETFTTKEESQSEISDLELSKESELSDLE